MRIVPAGMVMALLAGPAHGQDAKTEARLRNLEAQVQVLQAELRRIRPTAPAAASSPAKIPGPLSLSQEDPAEAAYMKAYGLWEQRKFADASRALQQVAAKYPAHRRASYARNLAGRAYLESGKPATAAKIPLANHELDPKGERAPDSLLYLSEALVRINKWDAACEVLAVLSSTYRGSMRPALSQKIPSARSRARCEPAVTGAAAREAKS